MTEPSNTLSVDRDWAASLVGLRMLVESRWWDGYDDGELNPGRIAAVDFNDANGRFFMLEIDSEPGAHYPMRYDAVLHYADETHKREIFHIFVLQSPGIPARARERDDAEPLPREIVHRRFDFLARFFRKCDFPSGALT